MGTQRAAGLFTPVFCTLYAANLCTVAGFGAFFLFPLFIRGRGGSELDIGILMGAFALASALCRPWISEMIDRIGRKKSYGLGCLLMSLCPLAYLALDGELKSVYAPLLLLRVVHGVGLAICFTAIFTWIADLLPEERLGEGIGIFGTSGLIGMALGPALGESALAFGSYGLYFALCSALSAVGLLGHLRLEESFSPPAGHHPQPGFFRLLARPKLAGIAGLTVAFGFAVAACSTFVAPMVIDRSLGLIFPFYLCYSGAAIAMRFIAPPLADRLGEKALLPWGLGLTIGGLVLLSVATRSLLPAAGLLAGAGHGVLFPLLNSLAVRNEPLAIRGKVTGIFTGSIDAGIFAGSLLLGQVGEMAGYGALFLLASFIGLCALILSLRPLERL